MVLLLHFKLFLFIYDSLHFSNNFFLSLFLFLESFDCLLFTFICWVHLWYLLVNSLSPGSPVWCKYFGFFLFSLHFLLLLLKLILVEVIWDLWSNIFAFTITLTVRFFVFFIFIFLWFVFLRLFVLFGFLVFLFYGFFQFLKFI